MAASNRCLFANVPIIGGFEWRITEGVEPYVTTVIVHESTWPRIEALLGTPQSLLFEPSDQSKAQAFTVSNVYALRGMPTEKPYLYAVLLADRRWKWSYPIVVRDCNIPRKTGDRTLMGADATPVELATSVDSIRFAKYSLNNEAKRWNARTLLESVLSDFASEDGGYAIESLPIVGDGEKGALSIQALQLRDSAGAAIGRTLAAIPGAKIRVELSGRAVVFDGADTAAAEEASKQASPATVKGEIVRKIDRRALRPSKVQVYFAREVEIRLDFDDQHTYALTRGELRAENVLPVPDPELTVAGRRVGQGTYVPVHAYLDACQADSAPAGTRAMPYSIETVRQRWIHGDLAAVWGQEAGDFSTTGNAAARAAAVFQHYRQTFRTNRDVMDRIQELRDVRVAILDTDTGLRAPAMAWSQYCILPSMKAQAIVKRDDPSQQFIGINKDDYPGLDVDVGSKMASQARVRIVDAQNGIFRLDYAPSPFNYSNGIIPCLMADENGSTKIPTRNLSEAMIRPICFGGRVESAPLIFLSPTYKCCVILTGIPAAPNNKRKLHRVTITPSDLDQDLRTKFAGGKANGPEQEVFMHPHQAGVMARFGWSKTAAARETLKKLLGFNSTDPTKAGIDPGAALPGYEWINENECRENAKAEAAAIYAGHVDGVEGEHETRMEASRMVGNVETIAYRVAPKGAMTTRTRYGSARPAMDRFAYLPTEVRQLTLRILRAED